MLVLVAPADKMSADSESLMSMGSVNDDIKLLSSIFFFSFFFLQKICLGQKTEEFKEKGHLWGKKMVPFLVFFFFSLEI